MANTTISSLINELRHIEGDFVKNVSECAESAALPALMKTMTEFYKPVPDKFRDFVDDFYNSYSPVYYKDRRLSMYNILDIEIKAKGPHTVSAKPVYKDEAMTFRDGSTGLIELTFTEGYHGGASGTSSSGTTVTSPYYKYPINRWTHWSRPAVQTDSPFERFEDWLDEYYDSPKLQTLINNYYDKEFDNALNKKLNF